MIATLRGILKAVQGETVIVEVNGLGYQVSLPASVSRILPSPGSEVFFYTHLVVRDEGLFLYGFLSQSELEVFRYLLNVGGVGPKGALGLISALGVEALQVAIAEGDVNRLTRVPGIGKKTAERIILELRDKVKREVSTEFAEQEGDVVAALVSLGYSEAEARKGVRLAKSQCGKNAQTAQLVRAALQNLHIK